MKAVRRGKNLCIEEIGERVLGEEERGENLFGRTPALNSVFFFKKKKAPSLVSIYT